MEQITDVNGTLDVSKESTAVRRKVNDNPSRQSQSGSIYDSPATVTLPEMNWPKHAPLMISCDSSLQRHVTEDLHLDSDSQCGQAQGNSLYSSKFHEDTVTELTNFNYRSANLASACCHTNEIELQLRELSGEVQAIGVARRESLHETPSALSEKENSDDLFVSLSAERWPFRCSELNQEPSVNKWVSDSVGTTSSGEVQQNVSLVHEFPQFQFKKSLKGKEVSCMPHAIRDDPGNMLHLETVVSGALTTPLAPDALIRSCVETDSLCLGNSSFGDVSGACIGAVSLRDYLRPRHNKLDEVQRLLLFKQIVELIHRFHPKGFALKHLRPSYFVILPSRQVQYTGNFCCGAQLGLSAGRSDDERKNSSNMLKRRYQEEGECIGRCSSLKHLKASLADGPRGKFSKKTAGFDKVQNLPSVFQRQIKPFEVHNQCDASRWPDYSLDFGSKAKTDILELEERWYASPEEMKETCLFSSSNIYSLGVLLFELFGDFESHEAHLAAMSDLCHRVLPSKFLSEHPKESALCLWMLHPKISSRPKTSDILQCEILNEDRNITHVDRLCSYFEEDDADTTVLSYFLLSLKEQREQLTSRLEEDLHCLEADIEEIARQNLSQEKHSEMHDAHCHERPLLVKSTLPTYSSNKTSLLKSFDQLANAYFTMRSRLNQSSSTSESRSNLELLKAPNQLFSVQNPSDQPKSSNILGSFSEGLKNYSCYTKFNVLRRLSTGETFNSSNVICSMSFDKNEDYFATAGVSGKIKIFEFEPLLKGRVDIHYPVVEMSNKSKLSSLCWNNYIQNLLASSDYDGIVQLWDVNTGQGLAHYRGHQKRAWSVDFSHEAPTKLASGSDDCSVKLWDIHEKNCIETIKTIGNVCCVQFSYSSHLLAFGSADSRIYCYDARYTRSPWCILIGHERAVSYIKFVDSETLVSSSTDSTLKLWNLRNTCSTGLSSNACSLTMTGHVNEKKFVGLSVWNGYIVCGSESNEVYSYYKSLPMPIFPHKFGHIDTITGKESVDDKGQFVSSVCWRKKTNMVVAANSSGYVKGSIQIQALLENMKDYLIALWPFHLISGLILFWDFQSEHSKVMALMALS